MSTQTATASDPFRAGSYGGPGASRFGSQLQPVQGTVEVIDGEVVVRIFTPERKTAVLTLKTASN